MTFRQSPTIFRKFDYILTQWFFRSCIGFCFYLTSNFRNCSACRCLRCLRCLICLCFLRFIRSTRKNFIQDPRIRSILLWKIFSVLKSEFVCFLDTHRERWNFLVVPNYSHFHLDGLFMKIKSKLRQKENQKEVNHFNANRNTNTQMSSELAAILKYFTKDFHYIVMVWCGNWLDHPHNINT